MNKLPDRERLHAYLNIAFLAIAAENASLDRRIAQSDFNTIVEETDNKPSRRKLSRLEKAEARHQSDLRSAIYEYGRMVVAADNGGVMPEGAATKEHDAQLLARHLP